LCNYPYASLLPVQPLQYFPSDDGVNITFLRKKTKEKGSVDGGIRIHVYLDKENVGYLYIEAVRNAEGQTVQKIFSEKIVVQELMKGLDRLQLDLGYQVESVFHKWMG